VMQACAHLVRSANPCTLIIGSDSPHPCVRQVKRARSRGRKWRCSIIAVVDVEICVMCVCRVGRCFVDFGNGAAGWWMLEQVNMVY